MKSSPDAGLLMVFLICGVAVALFYFAKFCVWLVSLAGWPAGYGLVLAACAIFVVVVAAAESERR